MKKFGLAIAVLLAGCAKDIQNKDAVRQGVMDYLNARQQQTGLNMAAMDVDVSSIQFENGQAVATVSFQPKNGGGGAMQMNYTLERKGDKWEVKGRSSTPGKSHGSEGLPQTPTPAPVQPQGGAMPPDHPPVKK